MEKKNKDIAKNSSSGVEKVENIVARAQEKADEVGVEEKKAAPQKAVKAKKTTTTTATTKKKTVEVKPKAQTVKEKAKKEKVKKEKAEAKKRVDAALKKEEKKAKKDALKSERKAEIKARQAQLSAERKEKQAARKAKAEARRQQMKENRKIREEQMKEKRAIRKAEAEARKELLKNESKKERAARLEKERAQKAAAKKAAKERAYQLQLQKKEARLKKREERLSKNQRKAEKEKQRTPGFGGWLAAVISLGAVTLALASALTLGAINMKDMNAAMGAGYRSNLYELVGIVDTVDNDLNKIRISSDPQNQSAILTNVLVQSRLAESNLEKFPIDMEADINLTSFINRTSHAAEAMLAKLRRGEKLSEADKKLLEKLYATNHKVRAELNSLSAKLTEKDMMSFMKEKKGNAVFEGFHNMENLTIESDFGADGPFSEHRQEPRSGEEKTQSEGITSNKAEELCLGYFKDYQIRKIDFAGETTSKDIDSYNFFLTDEKDRQLFAEISRKDGALIEFDFYEHCTDKNFDAERCKAIAEEYLASLGYEDLTAVWVNESGAEISFNFVSEQDGAVFYGDSVKVKVCETKGKVVGFDAVSYLKNHRERQGLRADLTIGEAMEKLDDKLTVEAMRLAVIPDHGGEKVTYEFLCTYGEDRYFVYIDANTGAEVRILGMVDSAQGRMLF